MTKPLMPNFSCLIGMGEEIKGVREMHEVLEPVDFRTMIHKTFRNDSTICNIIYFNFNGRENNLLRRLNVGHLVD